MDTVEGATEVGKEVLSKADKPVYVLGIAFLILLCAVLYGGYIGFTSFAKPLIETQLQSVQASTEAIKTNAETNRKMSVSVEKMSTSIEEINTRMGHSVEKMGSVVDRLQATEESQTKTLEKIANQISERDKKSGG